MTTDTAKRLSDANAEALAKLEARPTNDPRIRDKTIQEIAILALERLDSLAPPSQGKVERAREKPVCSVYHSMAIGVVCSNCGHPKEAHDSQALTEPAQGTSVGAMREAAKLARNFLVTQEVEYEARGEVGMWRKVMAKLDNALALPLPVSADGRDAVIEECAWRLEVDGFKHCAATLRALTSSTPTQTEEKA